jgi:hypothetical protein
MVNYLLLSIEMHAIHQVVFACEKTQPKKEGGGADTGRGQYTTNYGRLK